MVSLLGCPYIDVRASLNSFVPKAIDSCLSKKLGDYYIGQLAEVPNDHDKVEFNIVFSCYYINLHSRVKKLLRYGFSELELDRIKFALLNITNSVIGDSNNYFSKDLDRIKTLEEKYQSISQSNLPILDKIYWLSEDCKRYGTRASDAFHRRIYQGERIRQVRFHPKSKPYPSFA